MVKCLLWGPDRNYEPDLYERLDNAIRKVIAENDEVEFLFIKNDSFSNFAFPIAYTVKSEVTEKKVVLTKICSSVEDTTPMLKRCGWWGDRFNMIDIPPFLFDKLLIISCSESSASPGYAGNKKKRKALREADILISSYYPIIAGHERQFYEYANRHNITLLNVANPETEKFIKEQISTLPDKEKMIITGLMNGRTLDDLAKEYGVTYKTIHEWVKKGEITLRHRAFARAYKATQKSGEIESEKRCTVIVHPENGAFLKERLIVAEKFLKCYFCENVSFQIEASSYAKSDIFLSTEYTVFTNYDESNTAAIEATRKSFPHNNIINMPPELKGKRAQYLHTLKKLLRVSHFVIFYLPEENSLNKAVRELCSCSPALLIDLSNPLETVTKQC